MLIDRVNIGKSRLMPVPEIPKSIPVFFKFFILADEEIIIWSFKEGYTDNCFIRYSCIFYEKEEKYVLVASNKP